MQLCSCYKQLADYRTSEQFFNLALARDSSMYLVHCELLGYSLQAGRYEQSLIHNETIKKLTPWFWPYLEHLYFDQVGGFDKFLLNMDDLRSNR